MWTVRCPVITGGMLSQPIQGVEINGLPHIGWEQFQPIRWALQQSHQAGRLPATIYCGIHGEEMKERQKSKSASPHGGQSNLSQAKRGVRYTRSEELAERGNYNCWNDSRNRQHRSPKTRADGYVQTPAMDDGEGWITVRRRKSTRSGENTM